MIKKFGRLVSFAALIVVSVLGVAAQSASGPGYHQTAKIEVGGEGGWDYLYSDSDAHRLYVSHATKVVVIDTENETVIGEIPNTNGVHGIAVASELGRGFISDGRDNAVTIFDLKTLKTIDTVKVGKNPDAILFDPATKRVFTFNGASSDSTVLDAATGKVLRTIPLGGKPEFATSDAKGIVFVNIEDKNEIIQLDSKKMTVTAHWPLKHGEEPSGMAIDRKNHRLFSVCGNKKMIIMNSENGKIVAEIPIGSDSDAVSFDPETKLAFSSNGEGSVTVVREETKDKFVVVETVKTQQRSRTMTLDTKTHKLYLPMALFGETPAPTADRPRPRPPVLANSFAVLVFGQ